MSINYTMVAVIMLFVILISIQFTLNKIFMILKEIKEICPDKNIWCYTGYDFEKDILGRMAEQWEETKEMLSYIDVLVDGEFKEALKSPSLQFKGSSNQRIIEVQPSLKEGHIVLWEPKEYVHVEVREN